MESAVTPPAPAAESAAPMNESQTAPASTRSVVFQALVAFSGIALFLVLGVFMFSALGFASGPTGCGGG